MGFGGSLRIERPSFRQNLIEDMISVNEGKAPAFSVNRNSQMINDNYITGIDVPMITNNGSFVAIVGLSIVGSGDVVGVRRKVEVI